MRNLIMLLFLPLSIWAVDKKNSNSLSPQTLSVQCPPNVTIQEGQKYDTSVTGFPTILTNNGGPATITYIEIFSKGNCANGTDLVNRNFTIRNAIGDIERCTQSIFIRHIKPDQIVIPIDTSIEYPKDKPLGEAILGRPLSLGSLEITFIDTKISNLCNIPVRIRRDWSIRDKCSNTIVKKSTTITLMAYQNSFEHSKNLVGDVCHSEGQIILTAKGDFGPYTYLWNNGATTSSLFGIPAGNYSVVVTDAFKCNQLLSVSLSSISESADVGGLIATENNYRVNPDSIYISDFENISKFCSSPNGGLHYALKVKSRKTGMMDYRFVKRSQVLDGVSTKDIVLIQKHILGKQRLLDTLRYFAADVNRNFNVTSSDIAEIRKLILGIKDTFTDVYPWYFFRPDWKSVITKFNSYESIYFKGLNITNYPRLNGDVLAVKMGDMDLSYNNTARPVQSRTNLNDNAKLTYRKFQVADEVYVNIFLDAGTNTIEGLQADITTIGDCKLEKVIHSILDINDYYLNNNHLRLSISTGEVLNLNKDLPILTIKLIANSKDCITNTDLTFGDLINSEYYLESGEEFDLLLSQIFEDNNEEESVHTVTPNPFEDEIKFQAGKLNTLKIYNSNGVEIFTRMFTESIVVNSSRWPSGLYFYSLENSKSKLQSGSLVKF